MKTLLIILALSLPTFLWAQSNTDTTSQIKRVERNACYISGGRFISRGEIIQPKPFRIDRFGIQNFYAIELARLPQRSINSIVNLVAGVDSRAGQTPNIKGARADGTAYYIDGVRLMD